MKKLIIAIMLLCGSLAHGQEVDGSTAQGREVDGSNARSQEFRRLTFGVLVGTGIDISRPSSTPLIWQIIGHYHFNRRFSAGIGTGVSFYEKPLIPLFAEVKVNICQAGKWIPTIKCGAGYGFALTGEANGGIYIHPAAGVSWAVHKRMKLLVQAGYEVQKLERLKRFSNDLIAAEFVEKLSHHIISLKVGIEF